MQALWWLLLVGSIIGTAWLAKKVLPRFFIKVDYLASARASGKGLKIYAEEDGSKVVVCEPCVLSRCYIPEYLITNRGGINQVICRLDNQVEFVDYDIILKDNRNIQFKIINVKEKISNQGYTEAVALPSKTAYADILINQVNDKKIDNQTYKQKPWRRIICFAFMLTLLVTVGIFLINTFLALIFGDVFVRDYVLGPSTIFSNCLLGLLTGFALTMIIIIGRKTDKHDGGGEMQ